MKKTTPVLITCLLLGCMCCQPEKNKTAVDKMQGVWVEIGSTNPFIEIWQGKPDGTLHGRGGQINERDTLFFEELIITNADNGHCYQALLPERDLVSFTLIKSIPDYLEWSNPENDFPADISYCFLGNDTLRIVLRGNKAPDTILMVRRSPK